jgi:hypothetical protein
MASCRAIFLWTAALTLLWHPRSYVGNWACAGKMGPPITLRGISQRKVCLVQGQIHEVDILVPDAGVMLRLPMVFARGNAPFILGREGFFDAFDITFEKTNRRTVFQLVEL